MNRPLSVGLLVGLLVLALGTAGYEVMRPEVMQVRAATPTVVVQPPAAIEPDKHDSIELLIAGFPRELAGAVAVANDLTAVISETGSGHGERQLQVSLRRGEPAVAVEDANVVADGSMLSMSHDSFRTGSTQLGDGTYLLVLPFTMDGQWDVVLTIAAGSVRGNVSLSIDVGGAS